MTNLDHLNYLEKYLQVHGIKYERIDKEEIFDRERHIAQNERHQIIVPCSGDDFQWDVICQKGSYGYDKGLLELYGNLVDEEKDGDSVVGWLTAQDVIDRIEAKETLLTQRFYNGVKTIDGVTVYGDFTRERAAIVALNIRDLDSGEVADTLFEGFGIATRAGAHCAPRLHQALGTKEQGAVRFSFSYFNTVDEIATAISAVNEISKRAQ